MDSRPCSHRLLAYYADRTIVSPEDRIDRRPAPAPTFSQRGRSCVVQVRSTSQAIPATQARNRLAHCSAARGTCPAALLGPPLIKGSSVALPPGAAVDDHGGRRKRTMLISLCDIAPNADNRPGTAKFHHQWRGRDTAHPPATQTEWRCTREARQTQNDTGEVGRDTRGTKPVFPCRALPCPGSALPRCPIRAKVVVYGTVTCLRIPLLVHDPRTTYSLTVFSPLAPRLLAPLLAS